MTSFTSRTISMLLRVSIGKRRRIIQMRRRGWISAKWAVRYPKPVKCSTPHSTTGSYTCRRTPDSGFCRRQSSRLTIFTGSVASSMGTCFVGRRRCWRIVWARWLCMRYWRCRIRRCWWRVRQRVIMTIVLTRFGVRVMRCSWIFLCASTFFWAVRWPLFIAFMGLLLSWKRILYGQSYPPPNNSSTFSTRRTSSPIA